MNFFFKEKRNRWIFFFWSTCHTPDPPPGKVPSNSVTLFLQLHCLEFCSIRLISAEDTCFSCLFFAIKNNSDFDSWWLCDNTCFVTKHFKLMDQGYFSAWLPQQIPMDGNHPSSQRFCCSSRLFTTGSGSSDACWPSV